MRIALYILACVWLTGCDRAAEPAKAPDVPAKTPIVLFSQPDVRQIAATYATLRLMTKEPVFVNHGLAMLCRNVTQYDVDEARKASGPHANTQVNIFMNDLAADTFGKPNPKYPVGSIIVKQKKNMGYMSSTQPGEMIQPSDGVGGMIKRPSGYDSAHGDWEYFYFESPDKIASGRMASCGECHSGAASKDFVFGGWADAAR